MKILFKDVQPGTEFNFGEDQKFGKLAKVVVAKDADGIHQSERNAVWLSKPFGKGKIFHPCHFHPKDEVEIEDK